MNPIQCTCPHVPLAPGHTATMFGATCPVHGKDAKSMSHADKQKLVDQMREEIESERPAVSWFEQVESLPLDDPMVKMCDSNGDR